MKISDCEVVKLSFANVKPLCLWRTSCSCSDKLGKKIGNIYLLFDRLVVSFWCNVISSTGEWLCNKTQPPFFNVLVSVTSLFCSGRKVVYCTMRFLWRFYGSLFLFFGFCLNYYLILGLLLYSYVDWIDFYYIYFSENINK